MPGPRLHAAYYAAPAPWIHLEFDIPRLGRRVDAVLVTPSCVIPIWKCPSPSHHFRDDTLRRTNASFVLLTRARQGMVIFVPP